MRVEEGESGRQTKNESFGDYNVGEVQQASIDDATPKTDRSSSSIDQKEIRLKLTIFPTSQ